MPNNHLDNRRSDDGEYSGPWLTSLVQWVFLPACLATLCLMMAAAIGCKRSDQLKPKTKPDTSSTSEKNSSANKNSPARAEQASVSLPPALFVQAEVNALTTVRYENGESAGLSSILESLGGGVGVCDFDRDGQLDIVVPGGGKFEANDKIVGLPTQMIRGIGDMQFTSCSQQSRLDTPIAFTHGVTIADYDNDGHCDLLVTGYGRLQLFHNMGDGTFWESAHACGLTDSMWSSSAAWCDINRDGCLDLYVCHYVNWSFANNPYCAGPDADHREICSPRDFDAVDHILYLNQGDGSFSDVSQSWGLAKGGKGLGVVAGDVDGDGLIDIYVANDTTENFLYRNRGDRFEEIAQASGVAYDDEGIPNGSMGVDLADFNGDLLPDLWAANYERESFALYRNESHGIFLHVSRPTGVTALAGLFVGFGTTFMDADGDSDLDVLVTNGHVIKYPQFAKRKQVPLLLENKGSKFTKRAFPAGSYFNALHEGRGLATGDFNRDGHLDLLISHINDAPTLLLSTLGAKQKTLLVNLIGRTSNRTAIGTQVVLNHSQGKTLRMLNGGGSYLSSHQPVVVFEIPDSQKPESLEIKWPSGAVQKLSVDSDTTQLQVIEQPSP